MSLQQLFEKYGKPNMSGWFELKEDADKPMLVEVKGKKYIISAKGEEKEER